jgi:2-(1,2-epoxy-1,2-dihydrophenyl)acetyl-CoA isomerase
MSDVLLEKFDDGVAVLTINRPEARNALNADVVGALHEALPRLARAPEVGCVVVTGAGGAFSAGGDVKGMAARNAGAEEISLEQAISNLRHSMETSAWLHEMPKPTIAMIPGACAGAGFALALACDLRYAAQEAKMTTAFANVGFSGDFGGSYFLSKIIGTARARELYYIPRIFTGRDAKEMGIVSDSFPAAELEIKTMEVAKKLANGPKVAFRYMKRNFNAAEFLPMRECFELEAAHHSRCGKTEDHKNAARAFAEKRQPVFVGR